EADPAYRSFCRLGESDLLVDRHLVVLSGTSDRDGVENERGFAREHLPIVGGGIPGEYFRRLRLLKESRNELDRFECLLRIDGEMAIGILFMRSEGIHDGAHGHSRIQLGG